MFGKGWAVSGFLQMAESRFFWKIPCREQSVVTFFNTSTLFFGIYADYLQSSYNPP